MGKLKRSINNTKESRCVFQTHDGTSSHPELEIWRKPYAPDYRSFLHFPQSYCPQSYSLVTATSSCRNGRLGQTFYLLGTSHPGSLHIYIQMYIYIHTRHIHIYTERESDRSGTANASMKIYRYAPDWGCGAVTLRLSSGSKRQDQVRPPIPTVGVSLQSRKSQ